MPLDNKTIQNRILLARDQDRDRIDDARESLNLLTNNFSGLLDIEGEVVSHLAPNFIMSTVRRLIPSLYFDDPSWYARPRTREMQERARAVTGILEYYWRELKVKKTMRDVILDALVYPFGAVKVGMGRLRSLRTAIEPEEDAIERIQQEHARFLDGQSVAVDEQDNHAVDIEFHMALLQSNQILEAPGAADIIDALQTHITAHQNLLTEEEETDYPREPGMGPSADWPYVERVTEDLFWDPLVIDPQDSLYMIHRIRRRVTDVQDDPLYRNTSGLQADPIDEWLRERLGDRFTRDDSGIPDELRTVSLYEVWDAETRTVSTWVEDGKDMPERGALRSPDEEAWPAYINGYPFRILNFLDVPGQPHGPGMIEYMKWPQRQLMRLFSKINTHIERSVPINELVEPLLSQQYTDDDLQEILEDPVAGKYIRVQQPGAFNPVAPSFMDPTIFQFAQMLTGVINENSAVSDEQRGVSRAETATQASISASAVNILTSDGINRVRDLQIETGQLILSLLRQFGPERQQLLVVGRRGPDYIEYQRNDVQAQWQLVVEMPTPGENERDKQNALNAMHTLGQFIEGEGLEELARETMRLMGFEEVDRFFAQTKKEVQNHVAKEHQLMMAGQPVQAGQGEAHGQHLELHGQLFQQVQGQLSQMQGQFQQENPGVPPQMMQQALQQNQQLQQLSQVAGILQQHMEQHQQLRDNAGGSMPEGRRRQAVPFPTGNPGKTESVISAQEAAV